MMQVRQRPVPRAPGQVLRPPEDHQKRHLHQERRYQQLQRQKRRF
jgi:hypothetical protein